MHTSLLKKNKREPLISRFVTHDDKAVVYDNLSGQMEDKDGEPKQMIKAFLHET